MRRKVRTIGIASGSIFLLLLIASFFIPVNHFRPTMEKEASIALGRKVQLGKLRLSLLRGQISAENLVISDDPRFSGAPFLTAKSVALDVMMMPLIFARSLRVTSIGIERPDVTLLHDAKGMWNYASLSRSAGKAPPQASAATTRSEASSSASSLFIKKLRLNDGRLVIGAIESKERSVYDHLEVEADNFSMASEFPVSIGTALPGNGHCEFQGNVGPVNSRDATLTPVKASIVLENPELTILNVRPGMWVWSFVGISSRGDSIPRQDTAKHNEPISFPTFFLLRKFELKNGRVILGSVDSPERSAFGQVNVTVNNFSATTEFNYNILAIGPVGESLKIDGKAGPINPAEPALTPVRASVFVEKPQLALIQDKSGSWRWSIGALSSANMKATTGTTRKSGPARTELLILPTGLFLDRLELKDGSISVGEPRTKQVSSYQHVNLLATGIGFNTRFPLSIAADLPSGGSVRLDGELGPLDRIRPGYSPLSTKVNIRALDLASTGFLDPALGLGGLVDLDAVLTGQNGIQETKGTAKFSRALWVAGGSPSTVPAVVDFTTRFDRRTNSGVLNPSTIRIGAAEAHLSGTYQVAPDSTVIHIRVAGNAMPAKDLQAFVPAVGIRVPKGAALTEGTLSTNLDIRGPTNRLVTDGQLGLYGAKMAGFDLGAKLSSVSSLTGIKTGTVLVIESLKTNIHIATNGLRFDNFNAVVPPLGGLAGAGTVDAHNNLNLKMAATITAGVAGSVGAVTSSIGSLLGQHSECKGGRRGTLVPFQIQGPAADPKFVPDVGGTAASLFGAGGCVGSTSEPKKKGKKS
jgi:AsmA protein